MLGLTLCSIQSFEPVSLRRTGRGLRTRGPGDLRPVRPTLPPGRPLRLCPAQNGGRLRAPGRGSAVRRAGGAAGGRGADRGSRLAELAARVRDGRGGGVAQGRAGGGGQEEGWRRQSGPGGLVHSRSVPYGPRRSLYCRSLDVVWKTMTQTVTFGCVQFKM